MHTDGRDVLALHFDVSRVENLGADRLLYGKLGERFNHPQVLANLPTSFTRYRIETGQRYDFVVPRDDVKFFDSKTGLRSEPVTL